MIAFALISLVIERKTSQHSVNYEQNSAKKKTFVRVVVRFHW